MNELTNILEQEFEIYAKYLKLAEKKKEALIKNNIEVLPKITDIERLFSLLFRYWYKGRGNFLL